MFPAPRPFDLFDPDRSGRIKLYVKRVFIADDAEILPRYLRFVRGLVDSADLPLNVSREKIQESPLLAAIRKGATSRVLAELERLADKEPQTFAKIWDTFGAVLKEGIYEDFERRDTLLKLARFKTTASADEWRSLKDYVGALKPNQTAIYYLAGDDIARLKASPHLEGFRARGVEVLLLPDPVDTFWVMPGVGFDGKPFKSVTQGAADLALIPPLDTAKEPQGEIAETVKQFLMFMQGDTWRCGDASARVGSAYRQRGLPGGAGFRTRPCAGTHSRRRRPAILGVEADPRSQSATVNSSLRLPGSATRTGVLRKTRRTFCSTRRGCSTASARPTPRRFPIGWRACSGAGCVRLKAQQGRGPIIPPACASRR